MVAVVWDNREDYGRDDKVLMVRTFQRSRQQEAMETNDRKITHSLQGTGH